MGEAAVEPLLPKQNADTQGVPDFASNGLVALTIVQPVTLPVSAPGLVKTSGTSANVVPVGLTTGGAGGVKAE